MRISDWSSDVCSSDLRHVAAEHLGAVPVDVLPSAETGAVFDAFHGFLLVIHPCKTSSLGSRLREAPLLRSGRGWRAERSEEHTSELQSLMRISYAVFCLKKKTKEISMIKENAHRT